MSFLECIVNGIYKVFALLAFIKCSLLVFNMYTSFYINIHCVSSCNSYLVQYTSRTRLSIFSKSFGVLGFVIVSLDFLCVNNLCISLGNMLIIR